MEKIILAMIPPLIAYLVVIFIMFKIRSGINSSCYKKLSLEDFKSMKK